MPRFPYADVTAPHIAPFAEELGKARGGKLLNVDKTLLHNPDLARASREFFRVIRTTFELSNKLRELVSLRVAVLNRAPYEFMHHAPLAIKEGYTQEQLDALRDPGTPQGFDALDSLVIRFCDAMTRDVQVPQSLFEEVRTHFSDKLMVELVAVIASYNYMARFLEAFDIQVEQAP